MEKKSETFWENLVKRKFMKKKLKKNPCEKNFGKKNISAKILGVGQWRTILTHRKLKPKTHEFSFLGSFGMRKLSKQAFFSVFSFRNFPKMKTRGFLVLVFGA